MRALITCALVLCGCGSGSRSTVGSFPTGICPNGEQGILLIDWTVRGSLPSTMSCSGISKITLYLDNPLCGEVQIDPIACALDKFRYDDMPEGQAELVLQGVDANGVLQLSGSATVTLTGTLPAKPTTVALH
jgi:hypothetical protein